MSQQTPLSFPFVPRIPLELPEQYTRLRREEPVLRVRLPTGDTAWVLIRYEHVRQMYTDPRFSRAAALLPDAPKHHPVGPDPESIVAKDPPEHTRLRRLTRNAFAPARIDALRSRIQQVVDDLLDAVEAQDAPADLVACLAVPLPTTVIGDILGVPEGNRAGLYAWSSVLMSTTSHQPAEIEAAYAQFQTYLTALVTAKRARPGEDLLSVLVQARDQHDQLSEAELVNLGVTLLFAGYETTASLLTNAVVLLLRYPGQWERLRADPDLIPRAVEELLRYVPRRLDGGAIRVATQDVELGGVVIRAGEGVVPMVAAANRDPDVFTHPDRLDVARAQNPHLAFGHGAHHCLGASLARLELRVALAALTRRFPRLRLAIPEADLPWKTGSLVVVPAQLPVRW